MAKETEMNKTVDKPAVQETKAKAADIYSAEELAANAKSLFGTNPECVTAALKINGKDTCTIEEAKRLVNDFLKKEVV